MTRETTHTNLLDAAQALVMKQGFSATTVDQVIARAGVTKGAFFYHFATKDALAHALVERWAARDRAQLDGAMARAETLARDPGQRLLVLVGLLAEVADAAHEDDPGCLYASYCYEAKLMDDAVSAVINDTFAFWHERLTPWFEAALAAYPPKIDGIDAAGLLALLDTVFEGGLVMARIQKDASALGAQLRQYRNYLELLFA
jgi:TetR/AcrR family transcriptional regulator, transcriptional repressor for nem operon